MNRINALVVKKPILLAVFSFWLVASPSVHPFDFLNEDGGDFHAKKKQPRTQQSQKKVAELEAKLSKKITKIEKDFKIFQEKTCKNARVKAQDEPKLREVSSGKLTKHINSTICSKKTIRDSLEMLQSRKKNAPDAVLCFNDARVAATVVVHTKLRNELGDNFPLLRGTKGFTDSGIRKSQLHCTSWVKNFFYKDVVAKFQKVRRPKQETSSFAWHYKQYLDGFKSANCGKHLENIVTEEFKRAGSPSEVNATERRLCHIQTMGTLGAVYQNGVLNQLLRNKKQLEVHKGDPAALIGICTADVGILVNAEEFDRKIKAEGGEYDADDSVKIMDFNKEFYENSVASCKTKVLSYGALRLAVIQDEKRKRVVEQKRIAARSAELERNRKAREKARKEQIIAQRAKVFDATNVPTHERLIWGANPRSTEKFRSSSARDNEYFLNELNRFFVERTADFKSPDFKQPVKGEFEKTADYKLRLNQANKDHQAQVAKKQEEFKKQIPEKRQSIFSSQFGEATLEEVAYDADREVFILSVRSDSSEYKLQGVFPVPIAKAPALKKKIQGANPWVLFSYKSSKLRAEKLFLQCTNKEVCEEPEIFVAKLARESQVAHRFGIAALKQWKAKKAKKNAIEAEKRRRADNSPERRALKKAALSVLYHPNYGLGGFCDKIYEPKLRSTTYGTLSSLGGTTRFPAIVANYDFGCITSLTGDRKKMTEFWVVLGRDDAGGKYRCIKIAGESVINDLRDQCDFRSEY